MDRQEGFNLGLPAAWSFRRADDVATTKLRSWRLAALLALVICGCSGSVKKMVECPSPDRKLVAILYNVSGGGATGYDYYRVRVQGAKQSFDPDGYDFQMVDGWGVILEWTDNRHLTITHANYPYEKRYRASRKEFDELGISLELIKGPTEGYNLVSPLVNTCVGG